MNSRLDRQVDKVMNGAISSLRTDINALKNQSQVIGPDSVIVQRITSGATWDISAVSIAAFAVKSFKVIYTPTSMRNPAATFTYSVLITGGTGYEVLYYWPDTSNTSPTQRAWTFTIANDANIITLSVQFILKCVDTGIISVIAL